MTTSSFEDRKAKVLSQTDFLHVGLKKFKLAMLLKQMDKNNIFLSIIYASVPRKVCPAHTCEPVVDLVLAL